MSIRWSDAGWAEARRPSMPPSPAISASLRRGSIAVPAHPWVLIGHRGASGDAPENTLAAFELALRQGADGIEFDVRLSSDGVPVVIHDARLERTTTARGFVHRRTWAELGQLDAGSWFNRRSPARASSTFAGEKIPSLAQTLEWVKERGCAGYVEIKRARRPNAGMEANVIEVIRRTGTASLVTVISFDVRTLARLRRLDSRIRLGIDFARPLLAVRRARRVRASAVLPHWAFASQRFIQRAHRAGLQVIAWDLDRERATRRLIRNGVDGVITNFPARLADIRRAPLRLEAPVTAAPSFPATPVI